MDVPRAHQNGLTVAEAAIEGNSCAHAREVEWRKVPAGLKGCVSFWWSGLQFPGKPAPRPSGVSWLFGVLLALLAAFLLFPDNQPLLDPDEGRQAEIPREMLAHADLLLPRMLGEPYYEKPPLQYWLTAEAYAIFGVRAQSARLVPALAGWLAVLFTFAWGRRALGARPAALGGLGLCLSLGFITLGRTVVLDSLLTTCVVASWLAAYLAIYRAQLRWRWWVASAVACGLGLLAKGPVAFILVAVPAAVYQFLTPGAARLRWQPWAAFAAVVASVAAPWYIAMAVRDTEYLWRFFWRANFQRFVTPFDHEQPLWFYLPILFGATFPWSLLWPALGYFLVSRKPRLAALRSPALGFCALATGWCVLFYSLSGCKSPPYIGPAFAPLALLLGTCMDAVLFRAGGAGAGCLQFARKKLARPATLWVLAVSAACYLTTGALGWQKWGAILVQVSMTAALFGLWWRYGRRSRPRLAWAACAAATLLFVIFVARDVKKSYASRHSPAAMARFIRRLPGSAKCPVVAFGRQWPSAYFYLQREAVRFFPMDKPEALVEYLGQEPKALVLVEDGPLLETLLKQLPDVLEARVRLPESAGQVALVVVRQKRRDGIVQGGRGK